MREFLSRVIGKTFGPTGAGKKERIFLREISSKEYGLRAQRSLQRAASRVRDESWIVDNGSGGHVARPGKHQSVWKIGPGDEPFLTQSLQVHFVILPPGGSNPGHGHQNEAVFYILQGRGYEIHDGQRYDWQQGDVVVVHVDSVHRHFNSDPDSSARALVFKAKGAWMLLGLIEQDPKRVLADSPEVGSREDWSAFWTPGVESLTKIVRPTEDGWRITKDGRVRDLVSRDTKDVRVFSVDLYEQEIQAGGSSAKHWHMADEVIYVLSGRGHSLHWDVEAEIDDKFYARVRREPSRHDFKEGDLLYIPQATIHQQFSDSDAPLRLLCAQNRLFKQVGYDNVVYLEAAPEYRREASSASLT